MIKLEHFEYFSSLLRSSRQLKSYDLHKIKLLTQCPSCLKKNKPNQMISRCRHENICWHKDCIRDLAWSACGLGICNICKYLAPWEDGYLFLNSKAEKKTFYFLLHCDESSFEVFCDKVLKKKKIHYQNRGFILLVAACKGFSRITEKYIFVMGHQRLPCTRSSYELNSTLIKDELSLAFIIYIQLSFPLLNGLVVDCCYSALVVLIAFVLQDVKTLSLILNHESVQRSIIFTRFNDLKVMIGISLLHLNFKCGNSQAIRTFLWDFQPSTNIPLPSECNLFKKEDIYAPHSPPSYHD